jgi:hypothetical protein
MMTITDQGHGKIAFGALQDTSIRPARVGTRAIWHEG